MIPQNSTIQHDPENGKRGDCDRACVASIMELSIDQVPHFYDYDPSEGGDTGHENKRRWLRETFGLKWIDLPFEAPSLEVMLESLATFAPGCHVTLTAKSKRDVGHTVIVLDGKIVHDPTYGEPHGLVGDLDGYYWLGFIGFDG